MYMLLGKKLLHPCQSLVHQRNQVVVVALDLSFDLLLQMYLTTLDQMLVVVLRFDRVVQYFVRLIVVVIVLTLLVLVLLVSLVPHFALLVPFDLDLHLIVVHQFDQVVPRSALLVVEQLVNLSLIHI